MSGKFINTDQTNFINSVVTNFMDNILKNPVYSYNQSKPTIVDYYNINSEKTTIDKALLVEYATTGKDSPIYYNKIRNFFIYGFQRIDLNIDSGEFGEEADDISGEAIILPNTIEPCPGDHFIVPYIKDTLLFKVIDVQLDTIDNGSNVYKITYKVTSTNNTTIEQNVADEYEFLIDNVGTNQKPVIKKSSYKELEVIDDLLTKLRKYYKDLFFNSRVQTFTFVYDNHNFYDPYMIQFLKNTDIINASSRGSDGYVYVNHSAPVPKKFDMYYDSSVFKAFEANNKRLLNVSNTYPYGEFINNRTTIFYRRYEDYFCLNYERLDAIVPIKKLNIFSDDLIIKIKDNTLSDNVFENIIVKYFNNNSDISKEIEELSSLCIIDDTIYYFYIIPFVIFCLEKKATKLLS